MTVRTSSTKVTFRRPFILNGLSDAQPAGVYDVEMEEELLDTVSLTAYRRTSTVITLHARAGRAAITEMVTIDPGELDAALARDAAAGTEGDGATASVHAEHAS